MQGDKILGTSYELLTINIIDMATLEVLNHFGN